MLVVLFISRSPITLIFATTVPSVFFSLNTEDSGTITAASVLMVTFVRTTYGIKEPSESNTEVQVPFVYQLPLSNIPGPGRVGWCCQYKPGNSYFQA